MHASIENIRKPKGHLTNVIQQRGIQYWQCLCKAGIPRTEALKIAAAIAKYDTVGRPPSREQRSLIMRYSSQVCRANLWRRQLI